MTRMLSPVFHARQPVAEYDASAVEAVSFGMRELFAAIGRRLYTLAGVMAAVATLVFLVLMSQPRLFTASATIEIDSTDRPALGERSEVYIPPTEDSLIVESEVGVVASHSIISRVIQSERLAEDPFFNKALRKGLFGGTAVTRDVGAVRSSVIAAVEKRLEVRRVGRTRLIAIEFKGPTAQKAAAIANAFAVQYIAAQTERRRAQNARSIDWLRTRLAALRNDLSAAEQESARYRADSGLLAAEGATLVERQLIELQNQLIIQRGEFADRNAQAQEARSGGRAADTLPAVLESGTISDLRRQEAEVSRRVAELRRTYGPEWQPRRQAEDELQNIRDGLRAETQRISGTLARQAEISASRVRQLEAAVADLRGSLSQGNVSQIRLRDIDRTADAARLLYESVLSRLRLEELRGSNLDSSVRIVTQATAPEKDSEPSGLLSLVIALAAGAIAAAATAAFQELFDRTVRSPEAIERATGLTTLSLMPPPPGFKRPVGPWPRHDVVDPGALIAALDHITTYPRSPFAQAFERLAARISLAGPKGCQVVFVTSPTTHDGKTLAAVGLARSAAASGRRTLIIDCDPGSNGLTRNLNIDACAGLAEVVERTVPLARVIGADDRTNLKILPWSQKSGNARAGILEQNAFSRFLGALRGQFDLIILEGAPVMDPVAMHAARCADLVVLTLRWRGTTEGQLEAALDILESTGAKVLGVALTNTDVHEQRFFSANDPSVLLSDNARAVA